MGDSYMKRGSASLIVREFKSKQYHIAPVNVVIIKKRKDN
jgi:hypothetical protein